MDKRFHPATLLCKKRKEVRELTRKCRHCSKRLQRYRARNLCYTCYMSPGIKERYVPESKYARRGVLDFNGGYQLPEPTSARPGSPEKIAVLEARVQAKQALFHPEDA